MVFCLERERGTVCLSLNRRALESVARGGGQGTGGSGLRLWGIGGRSGTRAQKEESPSSSHCLGTNSSNLVRFQVGRVNRFISIERATSVPTISQARPEEVPPCGFLTSRKGESWWNFLWREHTNWETIDLS